jgi:hypothetical protein
MLKDALNESLRLGGRYASGADVVQPHRLTKAADEVLKRHAQAGVAPVPPDLDEIAERLRQTAHDVGPRRFQRRDLRYAPHCLWSGTAPIAQEDEAAASVILSAIADKARRSLIKTLATSYLRHFHPHLPLGRLVGETLTRLAPKAGGWVEALSRDYDAFNHAQGIENLAADCFARDEPPDELFERQGLQGGVLSRGLSEQTAQRCLTWMRGRLSASPNKKWVETIAHWTYRDGAERFVEARYAMVRGLVGPFRDRAPRDDLKHLILDLVLARLKDPRLSAHNWEQVSEERDIVKGWLTEQSLRQFLDVVDRTARPEHWRYRRAFWEAFHRQGLITEAWVAFASAGQSEARRAYGRSTSFAELRQSGKAVERGHAVLIMRIGQFMVCDWSHNGRCIIWPLSDGGAPSLYRLRYYSGDLAPRLEPDGGLDVRHHGSNNYTWQREINGFIRQHVGKGVSERAFQVTDR